MTTRMLIDARHQEETRVAVVSGNRIEELDFESAEHKQIKGNIYLAKVTRVEPSLQAAFVDYGGNRHGFLAFSEIHPDYYQIPREDRDRLLAEEAEAAAEEAKLREQEEDEDNEPAKVMKSEAAEEEDDDLIEVDTDDSVDTIDITEGEEPSDDDDGDDEDGNSDDDGSDGNAGDEQSSQKSGRGRGGNRRRRGRGGKGDNRGRNSKGGGRGNQPRASDEARAKRMNIRRRYKIQDVIHRRQVLLVQVVKEERGNKGAALTTYMSLAGRYCVLMPNTTHGGGISRKISNASDRKRLKSIIADMNLPSTMGCIVRTAGMSRTKTEIRRDFDYLARLWDEIREKTLSGAAPMLIHSDSDLIKRAIRDIYNRDISEVMVEGEYGYRAAKDFMKLLMPSHAKRVQQYADSVPLFQRYNVEDQLSAMYQPIVQLKSGGYIVINPTEALVSIDINSGRSTKEHGIEQTALSTNLEAAKEIARQLRLRDMAGLVVIDFIDMERHGNSRKVERAMKDALKNDRARIQVGRISSFGLMEMSRQRLRTGVLEASTRECPHCEGTGLVRTASSSALSALRMIEEEASAGKGSNIQLQASQEATIYLLNSKRAELADVEERYGVSVAVVPNGESEGAKLSVSASGPRPEKRAKFEPVIDDDDLVDENTQDSSDRSESDDENDGRNKKRRRGRRGGRGRNRNASDDGGNQQQRGSGENDNSSDDGDGHKGGHGDTKSDGSDSDNSDSDKKPRRSRRKKPAEENADADEQVAQARNAEDKPKRSRRKKPVTGDEADKDDAEAKGEAPDAAEEKPKPRRRATARKAADADASEDAEEKPKPKRKPAARAKKKADADESEAKSESTEDKPKKAPARRKKAATGDSEKAPVKKPAAKSRAKASDDSMVIDGVSDSGASEDAASAKNDGPKKSGWWQRTFG